MSFALTERPVFAHAIKRDVCYGLYLFALPVQQAVFAILQGKFGWNGSVYWYMVISIVIIWIFAEATYRFVELPAARKANEVSSKLKENIA